MSEAPLYLSGTGDDLVVDRHGNEVHRYMQRVVHSPGGLLEEKCRGTSLIRNTPPVGPYSRTMPRVLRRS